MDDDPESTLLASLRAIAKAPSDSQSFAVRRDGVEAVVRFQGGSSASVTFATRYDTVRGGALLETAGGYRQAAAPRTARRPLGVTLRREEPSDRSAKASGLNVEVQTGDATFDAFVYVDSPSEPDVVRQLLAPAEVRAAVIALLRLGVSSIVIDDALGQLHATLVTFPAVQAPRDERAETLIASFAALVKHLPHFAAAPRDGSSKRVGWLDLATGAGVLLGALGVFGGVPAYVLAVPSHCRVGSSEGYSLDCTDPLCCQAGLRGLGGGIVLAILVTCLAWRPLRAHLAGRSDSASRLRFARVALFFLVAVPFTFVWIAWAWQR